MADFKRLRELSFDRKSKRTGNPEQLRVQLMQVDDGAKFAILTHFWRASSGDFCPPSRDTLRITIKRSEAAEVIALLRELLADADAGSGAPAEAHAATSGPPASKAAPEANQGPAINDRDWRRIEASQYAARCCFCNEPYPEGSTVAFHPEAPKGRKAGHWSCLERARGIEPAQPDPPDQSELWAAPISGPPLGDEPTAAERTF